MACQIGHFTTEKLFSYMKGRGDHKLVVPMFQRNICWNEGQEDCFIDSLAKGYPVGSMLFHETDRNGDKAYVLIDGLQRCNTIKKYMEKPLPFYFSKEKLPEELCSELNRILALDNAEDQIRDILSSHLLRQNDFSSCDELTASDLLIDNLCPEATRTVIKETNVAVREFLKESKERHSIVAGTEIPVIIYTGNDSDLSEIFSRINSKGTVLKEYEVYAALWPSEPRYTVKEKAIVEYAKAKYRTMRENDFAIYSPSQDGIQGNKLSAFDFLFGLSRYLDEKHEILKSGKAKDGAEILTAGFELTEVCLSRVPAMPRLYEHLSGIDINQFAEALSTAVSFTEEALNVIKRFKANNQKGAGKKFKDKNQILAISGRVFRLLYPAGDFSKPITLTTEEKRKIQSSILENYVHDIIKGDWDNAGKKKRFAHAQDDKYLCGLSFNDWSNTLDAYFRDALASRKETDKVPAPSAADCVILNCIYVNSFSARDQLSAICFDIEHLAPKNQMMRKLKACGYIEGLAISSIANLCYLPQEMNRRKHDKTIYQDKDFKDRHDLALVEKKYSFTEEADLSWLDKEYGPDNFSELRDNYNSFCRRRFSRLKERFLSFFGKVPEEPAEEEPPAVVPGMYEDVAVLSEKRKMDAKQEAVYEIGRLYGKKLTMLSGAVYQSADMTAGFIIPKAKANSERNPSFTRFFFSVAHRQIEKLKAFNDQYLVVICEGMGFMRFNLQEFLPWLSYVSPFRKTDDSNEPEHWDPEFHFYPDGRIILQLGKGKSVDVKENFTPWTAS